MSTVNAPVCDCCGATDWNYAFSENGVDLGRCGQCGLYYVAQMPARDRRMTELEAGHFAGGPPVLAATQHLKGETARQAGLQHFVDLARRLAPAGAWLDIGCGTGMLMVIAKHAGIAVEGIELSADRRAVAYRVAGVRVHDRPLEALEFPSASFAAVMLINVFSHLVSPTETLAHIRRVLVPGGIVLLRTGEVGPGAQRRHVFSWGLGDHLYFLGTCTVERYAQKLGYHLAHRERVWFPATVYTRQRFLMPGPSRVRNVAKRALLIAPGALPLLRWYMLTRSEAGNPVYTSTLVLRKLTP